MTPLSCTSESSWSGRNPVRRPLFHVSPFYERGANCICPASTANSIKCSTRSDALKQGLGRRGDGEPRARALRSRGVDRCDCSICACLGEEAGSARGTRECGECATANAPVIIPGALKRSEAWRLALFGKITDLCSSAAASTKLSSRRVLRVREPLLLRR